MIRSLLHCLLFVIGMTVSGMAQAAPGAEAAIAAAVQAEMSAKAVPSVAVALVDRNGLIWSQAWGFATSIVSLRLSTVSA